jgi:hypothetical protein
MNSVTPDDQGLPKAPTVYTRRNWDRHMNETSKILESGIQSTPFLSIKRPPPTTLSQLPRPPITALISQSRHPSYPIHIPYPLTSTLKKAAECYSATMAAINETMI